MLKQLNVNCRKFSRPAITLVCGVTAAALLAGCTPAYNTRPGYYGGAPTGYQGSQCYQGCGYVKDIREVQLGTNSNGAVLGTVIGAVVGGLVGHQIGGGRGKTAATVAGAVGGGFAGHAIGERTGQGDVGWQIVVQLQDGQYATVTQRTAPQVRVGDYVMIRGDQVYRY
ncbi:MAG TPA: glycine zipper 2TM domain-containing protein [Rhodanobacteraceae bacterium]